ncbi:MAG: hypothetical protein ACK4ND_19890, partial [Cytophagaceae bacterium]
MKQLFTKFKTLFAFALVCVILSSCSTYDNLATKWKYRNDFRVKTTEKAPVVAKSTEEVAVATEETASATEAVVETNATEDFYSAEGSEAAALAPLANVKDPSNKKEVKKAIKEVKKDLKKNATHGGSLFSVLGLIFGILGLLLFWFPLCLLCFCSRLCYPWARIWRGAPPVGPLC